MPSKKHKKYFLDMHETIYRQNIIDHYRFPRNFGKLKHPTHTAGHANISCGDQMQFQAKIIRGVVQDIAFTGEGCAVSIAGASLIGEYARSKKLSSIQRLTKKDIEKLLGITISGARERCAMLGLETLQALETIT